MLIFNRITIENRPLVGVLWFVLFSKNVPIKQFDKSVIKNCKRTDKDSAFNSITREFLHERSVDVEKNDIGSVKNTNEYGYQN